MTGFLTTLIPWFKALHIGALIIWCGGLVALPLMLARHDPAIGQADYSRIRHASHFSYTLVLTPSAVIAVIAGTWLIFLRDVHQPWMFAKLLFVAMLVGLHGWLGHTLLSVAETAGRHRPPGPALPIALAVGTMLTILALVLGKPDLAIRFPDWLGEPQGRQLPFDVPMR